MSSCNCKHRCCHNVIQPRQNNQSSKGSWSSNPSTRGLLRLNSTGEVSSANEVKNFRNSHKNNNGRSSVNANKKQHYNQHSYKNFVDNLNMGSLINSASAYLDTATSYFGSFCPPYNTAKGLVSCKSDNSSFTYLKNMISGVSQSFNSNPVYAPEMNSGFERRENLCNCDKVRDVEDQRKSTNWNRNIFGAFHCNLLGNNTEKMIGVHVEKYVPPHRRYHCDKNSSISSTVDPKLTPYNARLLENSKKIRPQCTQSNVKKDLFGEIDHCSFKKDFVAESDQCSFKNDLLAESNRCSVKKDILAENPQCEQKSINGFETHYKEDPQKISTEKSPGCSPVNSECKSDVLYIRGNRGKRGKPSAKKRRRQRARQNETNDQTSCHKSSSNLKPISALNGNSAMAFILGFSTDKSERDTNSFHVSCDIDDGLVDWSDSDLESDETCSSLEDESMFENGLGFQCNNPLIGLQCFQVTCTVNPPEEAFESQNSSAIDNINLLWKVQVSVKPENPKKKSCTSKKVHFAEDEDLATVHPMIAWSYAYQEARKGPWEQYARDRGRFLRKITDGEKLLGPILNQNHRDKIYKERFLEE